MYRKQLTYKKKQIKQQKDLDLSVNCKKKKIEKTEVMDSVLEF